jgi:hypothetical protein
VPHDLVTGNHGEPAGRQITFAELEVGTAHAAGADGDRELSRTRDGICSHLGGER